MLRDAPSRRGSIPAHTGKPPGSPSPSPWSAVYPRPHGEASRSRITRRRMKGLSPPTRGSHRLPHAQLAGSRSIPAHTGKPWPATSASATAGVYPRPHGEAIRRSDGHCQVFGLSPPTRGSHVGAELVDGRLRSIPAHTGKPCPDRRCAARSEVYPRPHGEANPNDLHRDTTEGLSPPTRGSRARDSRAVGSSRVYPRPHGEARARLVDKKGWHGLSPPTRGSLGGAERQPVGERSIPAHTGKPMYARPLAAFTAVYPRPHGEAGAELEVCTPVDGLSPPTRGSLRRVRIARPRTGSIPAHTGKPRRPVGGPSGVPVYPRPHGEATVRRSLRDAIRGLSPPTRGSPGSRSVQSSRPRSIPAHTGKPNSIGAAVGRALGLSPPTRGSHEPRREPGATLGSIPAHTGKPPSRPHGSARATVYPRPHGEARCSPPAGPRGPGLSPPTRGSRCLA